MVGAGGSFGLLALFAVGARQTSAVGADSSDLLLLRREEFLRFADDHPRAAFRIAAAVAAEVAQHARAVTRRRRRFRRLTLADAASRLGRTRTPRVPLLRESSSARVLQPAPLPARHPVAVRRARSVGPQPMVDAMTNQPGETDGVPIRDALTFDDVLLVPAASQVLPRDVSLRTRLTREIALSLPFVSAAMDTVTEHETAICMAQNGGLGVVHRNLPPAVQAAEVAKVKRFESGLIVDPVTMRPEQLIREARRIMAHHRISGVPVTKDGKAVGILTNRDLRFVRDDDQPISNVMTPREKLVTVAPGTQLERCKELLHEHRIEKLLVVDEHGDLRGLLTIKDIEKNERFPNAAKDEFGRLRCGAAVGVGPDRLERAQALVDAGVDVIVVDTAHGHSQLVLDTLVETAPQLPEPPDGGRQRRHGRGRRGADQVGRVGRQGGCRPRARSARRAW